MTEVSAIRYVLSCAVMQVESVLQGALQDHIPPEHIPDFLGGTWQVQCCVWLCIDPNPPPYIHTQWMYPKGGLRVPWELFDQCESSEEDLGFECLYQPTTVARGNPLLVSAPFAYDLSHMHVSTLAASNCDNILPLPSSSPPWLGPSGCDEARAGCAVGVGGGQRRSRVHIAQTNWMCLLSGGCRDGG